ncbi:MAG: hypothetical protein ACRD0K_19455 [Egibacteraceae bacterium]
MDADRLDIGLLDPENPFEVDDQAAHLFKHAGLALTTFTRSGTATPSSTRPSAQPTG